MYSFKCQVTGCVSLSVEYQLKGTVPILAPRNYKNIY